MAYRIGEQEFETEQEYLAAKSDLERIKDIMASYDMGSKDGAKAALDFLGDDPGFESDYGRKFVEKLKKAAGGTVKPAAKNADTAKATAQKKSKTPQKVSKAAKPQKTGKGSGVASSVHIVTVRNIMIVIVAVLVIGVIVGLVKHFSGGGSEKPKEADTVRNLVMGYASNQVSLKSELYNYYLNVKGEDESRAKALADARISEVYAIDVSVMNLEKMSDEYIGNLYTVLVNAGEIENGAYNEPPAVTELKRELNIADATGSTESSQQTGNADITYEDPGNVDDGLKINLINRLMDYQQRIATALNYEYSHFGMDESEVKEYVIEDMEQMFGNVIYDMTLTEEEKIMYFETEAARGIFGGGDILRFNPDPAVYELPDLTPSINLVKDGEKIRLTCIQESTAPVYSVAYRLTDGEKEGYLMFRSNENMSVVMNDDSGNGTFIQGDVLLNWDGEITLGEWYFNAGKIGFAIGNKLGDGVEYIHEITY
ncbi:MAG: hypothetical protein K5929_03990 [Lachnospiraceae bacterium]|nr:hypothetical protein [Lachnospiraceae bacterium]